MQYVYYKSVSKTIFYCTQHEITGRKLNDWIRGRIQIKDQIASRYQYLTSIYKSQNASYLAGKFTVFAM